MPIKYGELTIIHDKEQTILTSLLNWFNNENTEKIKYIFLFDDGEICDSDKLIDFNFYFFQIGAVLPIHFQKNNDVDPSRTYFRKKINTKSPDYLLYFNQLFSSYLKFNCQMIIPSEYNSIYFCYKSISGNQIFGLIRIKSTEQMPRFQFAYDSDEFTKEEIIYIIHHIFNPSDFQN